jgi:hypothetical protein
MGMTATVCRIDEDGRIVFDEDNDQELGLDDDGRLDLDQSWGALQTMLESVTSTDLFEGEALEAPDVVRLAKVLKSLVWKTALEECEFPEDEDLDYVKPYFKSLRKLVLAAAEEGSGLRFESM